MGGTCQQDDQPRTEADQEDEEDDQEEEGARGVTLGSQGGCSSAWDKEQCKGEPDCYVYDYQGFLGIWYWSCENRPTDCLDHDDDCPTDCDYDASRAAGTKCYFSPDHDRRTADDFHADLVRERNPNFLSSRSNTEA